MLAIILALLATIGGFILVGRFFDEALGFFGLLFGVGGVIIFTIMITTAILNNLGIQGQIAKNEQRYESLVYQLENNLYDNDNDIGKKELYNQIQKWNEDLANGKAMQHDIWVGVFYPNIYDHFEFIELK